MMRHYKPAAENGGDYNRNQHFLGDILAQILPKYAQQWHLRLPYDKLAIELNYHLEPSL